MNSLETLIVLTLKTGTAGLRALTQFVLAMIATGTIIHSRVIHLGTYNKYGNLDMGDGDFVAVLLILIACWWGIAMLWRRLAA